MHKFTLVILLIANLLVCPLRCYSCDQPSDQDQNVAATADFGVCSCCQSANFAFKSQPDNLSPITDGIAEIRFAENVKTDVGTNPPEQPCQCSDCLCDGATMEKGEQLAALGNDCTVPHFFDTAILHSLRPKFFRLAPDRCTSCLNYCGEDPQAAYQVWRI